MEIKIENAVPDGFTYERAHKIMHGRYGSMEFLVVPMSAEDQFQIQLYADVEGSAGKDQLFGYLKELQQRHSFVPYAGYNGKDMVSVYVSSKPQEDKENLTLVISEIEAKCQEYGIHNCCPYCGQERPVTAAVVDQIPTLLCDSCGMQLSNGGGREKKENLPLGLVGAVIGVLLGSVLWVVLGQVGFIAGIAGYAIVFCGMKGYALLGKELSKTGIALCVILSLLMVAGAEIVSLAITIYRELGSLFAPTIWDAIGRVPEFLKEQDVLFGVGKDLAVGYILAIWASYASVKNAWQQVDESQRPHTVERF